jgi:isocitrate dehydrogenase
MTHTVPLAGHGMAQREKAGSPAIDGGEIRWDPQGRPLVPDHPIIPYLEGDGIGPDIWFATRPILDRAVDRAYGGKRQIVWKEALAGEKAQRVGGTQGPLPEETLETISRYGIAIKGPLTTPVGNGIRSLNVTLRQRLDLYACVRPVRYLPGVPAPVRHPERVDVVIFRENTEDVYAGVEWPANSPEAREMLKIINGKLRDSGRVGLSMDSAVGIKPMSERSTCRLVIRAIRYAMIQSGEGAFSKRDDF